MLVLTVPWVYPNSRRCNSAGIKAGLRSRAFLKCTVASSASPRLFSISPIVKCCSQELRSEGCRSKERWVSAIASSRYCRLCSTLARFSKTSELEGATAKALRKHSIELYVSPLIRRKFPIWLNNTTLFSPFKRDGIVSSLRICSYGRLAFSIASCDWVEITCESASVHDSIWNSEDMLILDRQSMNRCTVMYGHIWLYIAIYGQIYVYV